MKKSRRVFLKNISQGSAIFAVGGLSQVFGAKSYNRIIGANDRIHMAIIGCNSRGAALAGIFAKQENTQVDFICDVDEKARQKGLDAVVKAGKAIPKGENDFRKTIQNKELDPVYIATPDHWHAPATIICCAAGKHVYVEKPLSHNPHVLCVDT
eukprot:Opistho-1_new@27782